MKIYNLRRTQVLPVTLQEAWDFFSSPNNLLKITPKAMGLVPVYMSGGEKSYEGQIIVYDIRVLPGITVRWLTEITHVNPPYYFIDDQRFGPYTLWHHQHWFREVEGGVEMTDEVNYAIPWGFLGRLAHFLFVGKKVSEVFDYRYKVLEEYFKRKT